MKTDSLIDMLAQGAGPAPRGVVARRLGPAASIGILCSGVLALAVIGPVPHWMLLQAGFWIKLAYAAIMVGTTGLLTARLARPAARVRTPAQALGCAVGAMALVGAAVVVLAPAGERLHAVLGSTWMVCPIYVLCLSLPALVAIIHAMRGLAPTRLRRAGFGGGLLAGALGAAGYSLACPELSPAFVAVWYTAGIGAAGLLGALLGPRLLRW
ncbi:DUF1109 domain-containing protein [Bordetella flabilis]|uniref:Anti-sigma F factor n=1 Tax=Bordetella flabilis TaxID=463014 RepID=A0A193GE73_9BORD|nr:DUF1109 domain-containing protein [Bordetella flabilis]ANN77918.1 hypothetical protein BAU07_13185 [Bordetella flabilis]